MKRKSVPSKKPKPGRPKLRKGEAKEVTKSFKCSPDESSGYERMAKAAGLGFSKWARRALNKAVKR